MKKEKWSQVQFLPIKITAGHRNLTLRFVCSNLFSHMFTHRYEFNIPNNTKQIINNLRIIKLILNRFKYIFITNLIIFCILK